VLNWVERQPWGEGARVGVAGFCYGGGAALRCAEAHAESVVAVACFYGAPLADAGRLECPVFAVYGSRDAQFPPATVDAFEARPSCGIMGHACAYVRCCVCAVLSVHLRVAFGGCAEAFAVERHRRNRAPLRGTHPIPLTHPCMPSQRHHAIMYTDIAAAPCVYFSVCALQQGQPHAFVTDLAAINAGGAPSVAWAAFLKFLRQNALLPDRPPVIMEW
jgi:hypothetical protein